VFFVEIMLGLLLAPLALAALYRLVLWVLGGAEDDREAGEDEPEGGWPRVTVLVPAHDEEALLADCLTALRDQDYPPERVRVIVLADRCGDGTAAVARDLGAEVLEREEGTPGKGSLLRWALERLAGEDRPAGLLAVVDADASASPGLLRACARLAAGGAHAVQAHHGVRRAGESVLGRLTEASARARRHVLAGREVLGLAAPLLGTGMVFRPEALAAGWRAEGLAEDRELGARLVLEGMRPAFAAGVEVLSEGPGDLAAARTQRLRWVRGEAAVARALAPPLLRLALRGGPLGRLVPLELAVDLMIPSLSFRAACLALLAAVAAAAGSFPVTVAAVAALAVEALPFVAGLLEQGVRGLTALAAAPLYVAWKAVLVLEAARPGPHPWRPTREKRA